MGLHLGSPDSTRVFILMCAAFPGKEEITSPDSFAGKASCSGRLLHGNRGCRCCQPTALGWESKYKHVSI